ncbi:hypothetical protein SVIOM342S_00262 [Streptomyces violaceorubidus]
MRLAEAQRPQVGGVRLAARAVDLVGAQHDGLAGLAQQPDDRLVGVGGTDLGVHDEDDRVGGLDGVLGLGGDGGVDAQDVLLPAAGVDDLEAAARPLGLVGDAVAGGAAGLVLDDRLTVADDAVHEGRLADIGRPTTARTGSGPCPASSIAPSTSSTSKPFGGQLHELRVLGVAERPVVVLLARALGVDVVVHEVRTSFIVVIGGAPGTG